MHPVNREQRPRPHDAHTRAKRHTAIEGTHRALGAGMYDADALEAINVDQLVTPTDRLLLRGGQMSRRRRPARSFATGSQPHIVIDERSESGRRGPAGFAGGEGARPLSIERFGQGSQPDIAIARFAQGSQPDIAIARFARGTQPDVVVTRFARGSHPTPPARDAQPYLEYVAQPRATGAQPEQHIAVTVEPASARPARKRGAQQHERTAIIRSVGTTGAQMFAMTVVIPALA